VFVKDRRRHLRIAEAEGRQDGCVQVGDPATIQARDDHRDVGPREGLQGPPDPLQRGIPREPDDPAVEGGVRRRLRVVVAGLGRPMHLVHVPGEDHEVLLGESRDGKPGAE
jgi:hypothetical protein